MNNLFEEEKIRPVDHLIEPSFKGKIREYMEANSFIYSKVRIIKFLLSTGYDIDDVGCYSEHSVDYPEFGHQPPLIH